MIHTIVTDYEAGQLFEGKVVSIKEFGAFVEFAPGKEGMVHISKLSKEQSRTRLRMLLSTWRCCESRMPWKR